MLRYIPTNQGCGSGPFSPGSGSNKSEFKNRIRILLALTQNQFKQLNFFHISSNIFMVIFLPEKMEILTWKCVKALFIFKFCPSFIKTYKTKVWSRSGENFLDPEPTKKSGSDRKICPRFVRVDKTFCTCQISVLIHGFPPSWSPICDNIAQRP